MGLGEPPMVVGIGVITFRLYDCGSLKGKRKILKSIIARTRNHFNVSMAEVAHQNARQRAGVGFALVGNDRRVINAKMDKLLNMVEEMGLAEIIDTEMEMFHL
jgi:uncharacterized protein YlxP (DUF503 family)